jgi:hypothetical protein
VRNLWLERNAAPDYVRAEKHHIGGFYFDILSDGLDRASFNGVRDRGYSVGVYAAHSQHPLWLPLYSESGARHAELVHARLEEIAPRTGNSHPRVQFDIESVRDPEFYVDCFVRWRQLRPTRDTSWTFEPRQCGPGSWISEKLVDCVTQLGIRVVPQFYMGPSPAEPWDMRPVAQDVEMASVRSRFPRAAISGFYDAALCRDSYGWDGFAFIQGRLPA